MSEEKKKHEIPADLLAQMDQAITHTENIAVMVAVYRKKLISEEIPEKLADQLTIEYHNIFWRKALGFDF